MRILLVEDDADHRELMLLALTGHDLTWQVEGVVSGEETLRHLAEREVYDLVLLDYSLPERDGLEVLEELRRGEAPPPVVIVTGRGDERVAVEAMKRGAYDYVVKGEGYLQRLPVVAQRAVEAHQLAMEHKWAEDEIARLNEDLEQRVIERTRQLEAINQNMQKEITERKRVEEELKKVQEGLEDLVKERTQKIQELEYQRIEIEKLGAQGLMAARIAHEINNPLAGIKNSFLLVKDAIPQDHPYYKYVGRIEAEINRIAHIVRQMFDVYRPEPEMENGCPSDTAINDVVALLENTWRGNNITIEIDSIPITIRIPGGLVRQVLYNILLNAIEASPRNGVVRVTTEVEDKDLILSISDQGAGIPLEVQSRIFKPFSTGKIGPEKRLGLGLFISKDIVEKLGGNIVFESEPGKGTIFRITLPIRQ